MARRKNRRGASEEQSVTTDQARAASSAISTRKLIYPSGMDDLSDGEKEFIASKRTRIDSRQSTVPRPGSERVVASPPHKAPSTAAVAAHVKSYQNPAVHKMSSYSPPPTLDDASQAQEWSMGGYLYTPITKLADNRRVNISGVIVQDASPRRSMRGDQDMSITIHICDASCISGTGAAKTLPRSQTVLIFHSMIDRIPGEVKLGQVLTIRDVEVRTFKSSLQVVAKSRNPIWSWAVYDPVNDTVKTSPNYDAVGGNGSCSLHEDEQAHVAETARWHAEDFRGIELPKVGRRQVTLDRISSGLFFDAVVEVLKIYTNSAVPDIVVTDYTSNAMFYRGNDSAYLSNKAEITYPDCYDGNGHVFKISLFERPAKMVSGLKIGDVVLLKNIRAKVDQRGMLEGNVGSTDDYHDNLFILRATGKQDGQEARDILKRRKAKFYNTTWEPENSQSLVKADQCFSRAGTSRLEVKISSSPAPEKLTRYGSPPLNLPINQTTARALQPVQISSDAPYRSNTAMPIKSEIESPNRSVPTAVNAAPRPLICCKGLIKKETTTLSDVLTTVTCPGAYKVKGRVLSTEPAKGKDWARLQCKTCKSLVPLSRTTCVKCRSTDHRTLLHCLRFSMELQETEAERRARVSLAELTNSQVDPNPVTIQLLFHGDSSQALLPHIDAEALFQGDERSEKQIKRFRDQLLFPDLNNRQIETTYAVHAYTQKESGKMVRSFAALREYHVLHETFDTA